MKKIKVERQCNICKKVYELEVSERGYIRFMKGEEHIQDALPELSVDDRELLISGICGSCFDNLFADDEEEEEYEDEGYQGEAYNFLED